MPDTEVLREREAIAETLGWALADATLHRRSYIDRRSGPIT